MNQNSSVGRSNGWCLAISTKMSNSRLAKLAIVWFRAKNFAYNSYSCKHCEPLISWIIIYEWFNLFESFYKCLISCQKLKKEQKKNIDSCCSHYFAPCWAYLLNEWMPKHNEASVQCTKNANQFEASKPWIFDFQIKINFVHRKYSKIEWPIFNHSSCINTSIFRILILNFEIFNIRSN